MEQNQYHSYNLKQLPKGCQYCVRGEKLVLFVTGICPRKCYFCPVSDEKYGKDVIYANERKISVLDQEKALEEVLSEAKVMRAKGAGITGGDPLAKLERTCVFIKRLKKEFGKNFHVHLYTSLNLVTVEALKQLHEAGLDEIRFHLDLDDEKLWKKLEWAKKQDFSWNVGVEVPLVVGKEKKLLKLVDFVHGKVDFLNLNELERADNKISKLDETGMKTRDKYSYAIQESVELGLKIIEHIQKKGYDLDVHLCTAKLKDAVQLSKRIERESAGVRKKFDLVDEEGMLTRGALYLEELRPGFGYRKKLNELSEDNKDKIIERLKPFYERIKKKFKLSDEKGSEEIFLDQGKLRILLSKRLAKKKKAYFLSLGLKPAVVVEYPTADQLEMEVEFLE